MENGEREKVATGLDSSADGRLMENHGRLWRVILPLALVAMTLIPYWQTAYFGFVNFDDPMYIYNNRLLTEGLTSERVEEAVFGFHEANWHPLVWLSYMVEVELFGMKPQVMHITNVLLHIANSLIVYVWLLRSTGDAVRSFLAALLFAIHPMHVESVAWITERKDVLSTLFLLATLIAYSEYVRRASYRWYFAAAVLFCMGLTAKAMLVTVPIILVLLDFWPLKRLKLNSALRLDRATLKSLLGDKVPFIILSIAIAWVTIVAQRSGGAVAGLSVLPFGERTSNSMVSVSRYVLKSLWPSNLSVFYPMPVGGWPMGILVISVVVFLSLSMVAWWARNRRVAILMGWSWFVVTLLPVIGIIQVGIQSMADRYSYVPMIGLSVMLLWGLPDQFFRLKPGPLAVIGLMTIALLFVATKQVSFWQNSITLFEHALAIEPANNFTSHLNLGNAYFEAGRREEARVHLEEAVRLNPENSEKVQILARSYLREGKYRETEELLKKALQINDRNSGLWLLLGNAIKGRGDDEMTVMCYTKAVALDSTSSEALNNLGLMLCRSNNSEGMKFIRRAINANPENAQAHNSLGNALVREGSLEAAQKSYLEAIRLADLPESKKNLEYVRELLGQPAAPK